MFRNLDWPLIGFWLRLVLAPTGLGVLFYILGSYESAKSAFIWNGHFMIGMALGLAVTTFLSALRLRQTLSAFHIRIGVQDVIRVNLQSFFYSILLPLGVGTEISRFAKISTVCSNNSAAKLVAALAADRIVGVTGLVLLALPSGAVFFQGYSLPQDFRIYVFTALGCCFIAIILGGILWQVKGPEIASRLRAVLIADLRGLGWSLVIGIFSHLVLSAAIYVCGLAFNIPLIWHEVLFAYSAAMVFMVLPISIAGAGMVEVAGFFSYTLIGLDHRQALLMVSVGYLYRLITAGLGGIWELTDSGVSIMNRNIHRCPEGGLANREAGETLLSDGAQRPTKSRK